MVKIQGSGCYCGNTSTLILAAIPWGSDPTASADPCITQYIQLNATDAITAMAIDGSDNLWVRTDPANLLASEPAHQLPHTLAHTSVCDACHGYRANTSGRHARSLTCLKPDA